MATIKSYTDLEQSKKLVEILPLESADMYYSENLLNKTVARVITEHQITYGKVMYGEYDLRCFRVVGDTPCWSLAALLSVIPYNISFNKAVYRFKLVKFSKHWECYHENFGTASTEILKADNPVDACYKMILKLHELKML